MQRLPDTRWRVNAGLVAFCALSVSGCSWSRFDDVSENAPVVALKKPGSLQAGFGVGLATARLEDSVQLLSIGSSPGSLGAVFELGVGESPVIDAVDSGHCNNEDDSSCASLSTPVGLARAQGPGEEFELCFISGIGAFAGSRGLLARCADDTQYELPVPEVVEDEIIGPILDGEVLSQPVFLAADRAEAPAVLAGVPQLSVAFFYAPLSRAPIELDPGAEPEDRDESFGASVSVLRTEAGRLFAVGAPEQGNVWLFRMNDGAETGAELLGCLGGVTGFGRSLAGGRVDEDDSDDLVIADSTNVTVLSGQVLAELPATDATECSFASLPEDGLLASFGCGSTKGVEGCSASEFGAALAVGDLDGDGDGEVVVGAPGMTVRGESRAGAVLVYDVEGEDPHLFSEVMFTSSLEQNDNFGSSLATPELDDRNVVAVGASRGGKTFLLYCPALLEGDLREESIRCR